MATDGEPHPFGKVTFDPLVMTVKVDPAAAVGALLA
jgi:hypothetical protein